MKEKQNWVFLLKHTVCAFLLQSADISDAWGDVDAWWFKVGKLVSGITNINIFVKKT